MTEQVKTETLVLKRTPSTWGGKDAVHTISDGKGNALMAFVSPVQVALYLNGAPSCAVTTDQFNHLLNELTANAGGKLDWKQVDGSSIAIAPATQNRLKALCEEKPASLKR